MGLKDAVKKVKEKVQGMAARPYIGIDMAAGEDMTAYAWQQETAQKPEEAPEGNQAENNSAQENEKGQERASGEATDALQKWLATLPDEKRQQELEKIEEFCKRYEMTAQGLAVGLTKLAEDLRKVWEEIFESIRPATEHLATFCREYFSRMDKWELEKMKMSNNERRRRGLPMVRRRAHVRNTRNGRKRRHRRRK